MGHTPPGELSLIDRYMHAIGHFPPLSANEEVALHQRARQGDAAARDQMIMANLRLVVKIAYDYAGMGVPLIDLISEGNLGLIKAVDRFSPARGGRLPTYAAWWIRHKVKEALASQAKTMRLPMHVVEKIAKLRRATNTLTSLLGQAPTVAQLAAETRFSHKRILQLQELLASTVSFEAPGHAQLPLEETLGDERATSPFATLLQKNNQERINEILEKIDARSAQVLRLRHGLGGQPPLTLDDVGAHLGLTRERVRQLEQEAQVQLRRILQADDRPVSAAQLAQDRRSQARVEVLKSFMIEKGLLKP